MTYTAETYQAKSGQWSWRISDEQSEICGGAGYATKESAEQAMSEEMRYYQTGDEK